MSAGEVTGRPAIGRRCRTLLIAGSAVVVAVPLIVALAVLRHPRWYPLMDLAQTELRVRDVGSRHPPLVGLAGRFGSGPDQASHPGPLGFWLMWPVYRLLGSTSWAMRAGSVALHLLAVATAMWVAFRRGGVVLALAVAAGMAVLLRAYGALTITEPWIPHLPLLWWLVLVLAVWAVVNGDLVALPVAVFAASVSLQAHVSYLGVVGGLAGVTVGWVVLLLLRHRDDLARRRRIVSWTALSVAVLALLWLPPLIEEARNAPGNLALVRDYFRDPGEASIGLRRGAELFLVHLNPWRVLSGQVGISTAGSVVPGAVLVLAWAAAAAVAWRIGNPALRRLHLVLAVVLVVGVVAMSQIVGETWYWLTLWAWGIPVALVLASAGTAVVLLGRTAPDVARRRRVAGTGWGVLVGVVVAASTAFTLEARSATPFDAELGAVLGRLLPPTIDALEEGSVPGGGRRGRYLVSWTDPVSLGAQGFGLLNELDREGFDVGTTEHWRAQVTPYRVMEPEEATAVVHLAVGERIQAWRKKPGVAEVAYVDPRTRRERVLYERLRSGLIRDLRASGLSDLIPILDNNLYAVTFNPRVSEAIVAGIDELAGLGFPTAVFVGPPDAVP